MPIIYNNYVKRPSVEHEYTQEEIQELDKCSKDVKYFLKYITIVELDKGKQRFKPREYQLKMLDMFQANNFSVVLSSRQSGKCVSYDTKIIIREKKTNNFYEIAIGEFFDYLYAKSYK